MQATTPQQKYEGSATLASGEWLNFTQLAEWIRTSYTIDARPQRFRDPQGNEVTVTNWISLLTETAEHLIRVGSLTEKDCPVPVGEMSNKSLIHVEPVNPNGQKFRASKRLSTGLWLNAQNGGGNRVALLCTRLVEHCTSDLMQFHIQLSQAVEINALSGARGQKGRLLQTPEASSISPPTDSGKWLSLVQLTEWAKLEYSLDAKPWHLRDPHGNELAVSSWSGLLTEMAEWFIGKGLLTKDRCPVAVGMRDRGNPYLIHIEPVQPNRQNFRQAKRLSNGLWLNTQQGGGNRVVKLLVPMVQRLGENPERFMVQLSQ